MTTSADKLVRMANQIAEALAGQAGDPAAETADHLRAFWAPAMRAALVAHRQAGGPGLSPLAAEAVAQLERLDEDRSGR